MTPGPTIIRECSACGKYIAQQTINSGNTFGARFWTDGKRDAPMLPDQPWLVKCGHCGAFLWIDEQTQVAEIDPWGSKTSATERFSDARPISTPVLQDYVSFLQACTCDKQKERYVRLRLWWAGNDTRRDSTKSVPLSSFEVENLRAFVAMLDETDENDRVMKSEGLRELGEFADAERLLATTFDEGLRQAVAIIRDLNQERVTAVAEMEFE